MSNKFVENLKREHKKNQEEENGGGERKSIVVKLGKQQYDDLDQFVKNFNKHSQDSKVSKQSILYGILDESGLFDLIKQESKTKKEESKE